MTVMTIEMVSEMLAEMLKLVKCNIHKGFSLIIRLKPLCYVYYLMSALEPYLISKLFMIVSHNGIAFTMFGNSE